MNSKRIQETAIRWIALDAVGTLIFADPPVHLVYWEHARRAGSRLSPDEIRERCRITFGRALREAPLRTDEAEEFQRWKAMVAGVLHDIPVESCFDGLFAHFGNPRAWRCFPDAVRLLRILKEQKIPTMLASNFDARLEGVCAGHAELRGIRTRVISSQVGVRKPHPDFYGHVVRQAGCAAADILMIGDDFQNDVEAARLAGLRALHLVRTSKEPSVEHEQRQPARTAARTARSLADFLSDAASIDSLDPLITHYSVASAGRMPDDPEARPGVARPMHRREDDSWRSE